MSDSAYQVFQRYGTNAERLAFVPDPPTLPAGTQPIYKWYETDTDKEFTYTTSWHQTSGSGSNDSAFHPFLLMGG